MAAPEDSREDGGGPRCIFDERIATLRCRDEGDFARIRASVEQLDEEISVSGNPMSDRTGLIISWLSFTGLGIRARN